MAAISSSVALLKSIFVCHAVDNARTVCHIGYTVKVMPMAEKNHITRKLTVREFFKRFPMMMPA